MLVHYEDTKMTVKEAMEKLSKFPGDAVLQGFYESGDGFEVVDFKPCDQVPVCHVEVVID